jgi:hypothetical protein
MFTGSITALVTPFRNDGIDEAIFEGLVEWQLAEGTNGLVPCGPDPGISNDLFQETAPHGQRTGSRVKPG